MTPTEIGGGFGGKNNIYNEALAIALSRKSHRPVKMVMTREEVFRATGPTSGANVKVRIGCTRDGKITAAEAELNFQAGAFPGSPVNQASMCAFTRYDLANVRVVGNDVTVNRPKVAAYRAPGAPIAVFGVESVIDEMAKKLGIDPIEFRLKNAAKEGTQTYYGPKLGPIGYIQTLEQARAHPHYSAPLGPNQGRGIATGFWFNIGNETTCSLNLQEDGTLTLMLGTIDVAGGSRASMAMMVAEELGIDFERVRPIVGDTSTLGFNFLTAGSRSTFASGMACVIASRQVIEKAAPARRKNTRGAARSGGVERWPRAAGRRRCRAVRAHVPGRDRENGRQDRRHHRRPCGNQCAGRRTRLRHAYRRCRGGQADGLGQDSALHGGAGRGQGHPSGLRRRPDAGSAPRRA